MIATSKTQLNRVLGETTGTMDRQRILKLLWRLERQDQPEPTEGHGASSGAASDRKPR